MGSVSVPQKGYLSGIHVPCLTWFKGDDAQEIDWDLQRRHLEFLVSSNIEGGM